MNSKGRSLLVLVYVIIYCFSCHDIKYIEPGLTKEKAPPDEWFFHQRSYPSGKIDHEAYLNATKKSRKMERQLREMRNGAEVWQYGGSTNISGRLTDVEMHAQDTMTIYVGTASGGIFKSLDQGASWSPIFDDALSLSIGDLAIAPSNPNVIYVGTGEANGGNGSIAYEGTGIYKSEDGGDSWIEAGLETSGSVGRIVVHPTDPNIVYVAAMGYFYEPNENRGIYKTVDGGLSWAKVLYIDSISGGIDMAVNPTRPDTVYACIWERQRTYNYRSYGGPGSGLYRSVDAGQSWHRLTNGLPDYDLGRIGITLSEADPTILYALIIKENGGYEGIYKSMDAGQSWDSMPISMNVSSYGYWFGRIHASPHDADEFYGIGFHLYKSTDGGMTIENTGGAMHVDQHAIYVHPLNPSFVLCGNDGGLYLSRDAGDTWMHNKKIPVTQFYTCGIDVLDPQKLFGGTQDNGVVQAIGGSQAYWLRIFGGDGMVTIYDSTDNNVVYTEAQYGSLQRSDNGGNDFVNVRPPDSLISRKNWKSPYILNHQNMSSLIFGGNRLVVSYDRGESWSILTDDLTGGSISSDQNYGTITTIDMSPLDTNIVWVGTDDGRVWLLDRMAGSTFNVSTTLPDRWVTSVQAGLTDIHTCYVTYSGFRYHDYTPYVFKTTNDGMDWLDITGNLPEVPVNDIIQNPEHEEVLYVATDVGVFTTQDGGIGWEPLGESLPRVPVTDLALYREEMKLIAATYGRGIYTITLPEVDIVSIYNEDVNFDFKVLRNPFSRKCDLRLYLEKAASVKFVVFNANGQLVHQSHMEKLGAGTQQLRWSPGPGISTGVYFIQLQVHQKVITKKVVYNNS